MNDEKLELALVQPDMFWEDTDQNLDHLDHLLRREIRKTDIIFLPEMFTTGFTMKMKDLAEENEGKGLRWMVKTAAEYNCAVTGSLIIQENGSYYNRLFWVNPDGQWVHYDKRHLFSMGREDQYYSRGNKRLIVNYKGWKICPLVCYDLRFPVWSRNDHSYDMLVYVANWPAARNHVWNLLLRARAIENQCYVVGVNRVGRDGENIHYAGESCVVHPKGFLVTALHEPSEQVLQSSVNYRELIEFRKKFPVLEDQDDLNDILNSR